MKDSIQTGPAANRFVFDLHGLVIDVQGAGVVPWFQTEYGRLATQPVASPDYVIRPDASTVPKPIKPKGISQGIAIHRSPHVTEILYDPGLAAGHIMGWAESLLRWPDKMFAHAAGVARNGEASVFFAGPNTGKTTTVLRLLQDGYDYLSDDWVVIGQGKAYPVPKTIKVFDYNLVADPALCRRMMRGPSRWPVLMRGRLFLKNRVRPKLPTRALRFAVESYLARMVRAVDVSEINPSSRVSPPVPIRNAVWLTRTDTPSFEVADELPESLANRIVNAAVHERAFHLGRFALETAREGDGFDISNWIDHHRQVALSAVQDADCQVIKIPQRATPDELLPVIQEVIASDDHPATRQSVVTPPG